MFMNQYCQLIEGILLTNFKVIKEAFMAENTADGRVIDLYHAASILSPRGTKSFVFARLASH